MASSKQFTQIDGSVDFSGGVNSYLVPTIASESNPNGLKRNQVSWLNNATMRGGGITQRSGWIRKGDYPAGASGRFQGKFTYQPDEGYPYIMACIGGHIWKIDPDDPSNGQDMSTNLISASITSISAITGQVYVTLRNDTDTGAGNVAPAGTEATIGDYQSFIIPVIGSNVNVATSNAYTGALGGAITINTFQYTIMAVSGFSTNAQEPTYPTLPEDLDRVYFCQAEQFLVIQAGDYVTLPLIWDGTSIRQSLGLTGAGAPPPLPANGYGTVLGVAPQASNPFWPGSPFGFHIPAQYGTSTISLDASSLSLGDYVILSASASVSGSNVLYYQYADLIGWVTGIAGSNVTIEWFQNSDLAKWNSYFSSTGDLVVFKPNFVTASPSNGSNVVVGTPEIPAAGPMDYYQGRLWYGQGRKFAAGDIVYGANGTVQYGFRDAVLKVTENPLAIGGDGFYLPANSGNIRAIRHNANINTQLGQGQLYIFTRKSVFSITVPVSRTDWIASGNQATGGSATQMPQLNVVLVENGAVNDTSIASQNGDLFFQSIEPAIRSITTAVRNFGQWGNVPISINEERILRFNDRSLMQYASGISFSNRVLQTALPIETPVGVAHQAIIPLNFDVISTLESRLPPVWEGAWQGGLVLQLCSEDYGGRQRAFATMWSELERKMQLWELSEFDRFDLSTDFAEANRVEWFVEFPAFTWGNEFDMKKLVSAELWFDRLFGEVMFRVDYRVDGDLCWRPWVQWKRCTARDCREDTSATECVYPAEYRESFVQTVKLPAPPDTCQSVTKRPASVGYQFQPRITMKGFCRIRGLLLKATPFEEQLYSPGEMPC